MMNSELMLVPSLFLFIFSLVIRGKNFWDSPASDTRFRNDYYIFWICGSQELYINLLDEYVLKEYGVFHHAS